MGRETIKDDQGRKWLLMTREPTERDPAACQAVRLGGNFPGRIFKTGSFEQCRRWVKHEAGDIAEPQDVTA